MAEDNSEYKSIAKANALFGGVQIFKILISLVNSKLVAVLLGPEGMGILGLLNSSIELVKSATNMGLQTSAVRDVTIAHDSGDAHRVATTKKTLSRWVWVTGLLGLLVTFFFSNQLSRMSFGDESYSLHFRILSIVLLITQIGTQYNILLQGTRRLKTLASSNVIGQLLSVVTIIPLYYLFGYKGIVPAIILTALVPAIVSGFVCRDIKLPQIELSIKSTWTIGKSMIVMGFMLGLTGLIDAVDNYIIKIVISRWGEIADVGLFNAGHNIVTASVGLAFAAIATDYYPRITIAANKSREEADNIMNKQFEILILVLIPIICLFIAFGPFLLRLLYSFKFVGITNMVSWMAVGMLIRAFSWCPAFLFLSKNNPKLYLGTYIINFIFHNIIYIGAYLLWGLTGLGIAFVVGYVLYALIIVITVKKRYGNQYTTYNWKLFGVSLLICGAVLAISHIDNPWKYLAYMLVVIPACIFSFKELDNRLGFFSKVKMLIHKSN